MKLALVVLPVVLLAACAGPAPSIRYYQLAPVGAEVPATGDKVIVVEPLASDAAYDDERIVYRNGPYRLDYYNYHRWSSPPGALVGGYLEKALGRTGSFKAVVRDQTTDAAMIVGGHITALEEVDTDPKHWLGRIAVELTLTDPKTGGIVWTQSFEETEPMAVQNPEGLARAISTALTRIATKAAPMIAEHANAPEATATK
ncbi:MAG: ABC-type transport auxiliary lipoprotein family protein [Kofleriaceae bacterium]